LPRPFLYLKESLLREYTRLGGKMSLVDAQALATGMNTEEAAEKLARVWEFLKITGGLRSAGNQENEDNPDSGDGEDGGGGDEADAPAGGNGVAMAVDGGVTA
jgi:transcriptional adapter 2-alpha